MATQRELERCGWQFFRIAQSAFTVDEASVLRDLWAALERRGIHPSDWADPAEVVPAHQVATVSEPATSPPVPLQIATSPAAETPQPAISTTATEMVPETPPANDLPSPAESHTPSPGLKPYETYHGSAPRPSEPAPAGMREALLAIVDAEGPVLGARLQTAYVRASGGQRVTRLSASAINKVISAAVRRGLLVQDNPLNEAGVQPTTFRLPSQPDTLTRELGPRTLDEVPPGELAAVMARHAKSLGWQDREHVFRATLQTYGRKALTEVAATRLAKVASLASL
jgi:hypothetical protein